MHFKPLLTTLFLTTSLASPAPAPNPNANANPLSLKPTNDLNLPNQSNPLEKRNNYWCCFGIETVARKKFLYIPNEGGPFAPWNPFDGCNIFIERSGVDCGKWSWGKVGRSCDPLGELKYFGTAVPDKCRTA